MFNPEDLRNCHIVNTPQKYQTQKDDLRQAFKKLTPLEQIVYTAYHINTFREIAQVLKRSYQGVRSIYKRACKKLKVAEKGYK